jgi:hypothetical protein
MNKKHKSHIHPCLEISKKKDQIANFSISKSCKEILFINENKILAMKCETLHLLFDHDYRINPSLSRLSQIQSPFAPKGSPPPHMKMN